MSNGHATKSLLCRMDIKLKGYETLSGIYICNTILGMKHEIYAKSQVLESTNL